MNNKKITYCKPHNKPDRFCKECFIIIEKEYFKNLKEIASNNMKLLKKLLKEKNE